MPKRVLYYYQWATLGGVERVLVNRAQAFAARNSDVQLNVYFLHDSGGKARLRQVIDEQSLGHVLQVVDDYRSGSYDLQVSIDTPNASLLVGSQQRLAFECHTGYAENRAYLRQISRDARAIAVPSLEFYNTVKAEFGDFGGRLCLLRNFVPEAVPARPIVLPDWGRRIVAYLGRMDELKNVTELLDGARAYRARYGDDIVVLLVGPRATEIDLDREIATRSLEDCTVVLPPIGFARTGRLFASLAEKRAVFASCSKAESFGLAVGEALASSLEVLVSDIPTHRRLVSGRRENLYRLGDPGEWAERLKGLFALKREAGADAAAAFRHGEDEFISDWDKFFELATR